MSSEEKLEQAIDELILEDLRQAIAKASNNPTIIKKGTALYRFQNDSHTRDPGYYWSQSEIKKKASSFYFKAEVIEDLHLGRMDHLASKAYLILVDRKFSDKWTRESFGGEGSTIGDTPNEHLDRGLALLRVLSKQKKFFNSLPIDGISDEKDIWIVDSHGAEAYSKDESLISDAESKDKLIHRGVYLFSLEKIIIKGPFDI